jgi:UDP-N-acetylglucosamine 2-epimerase (non-hydrolysing)
LIRKLNRNYNEVDACMNELISIIGTRPEIIKMAPLIPLLDEKFEHKIVYTGQHYDYEMSEIFFKELNLRRPDYKIDYYNYNLEQNEYCLKPIILMLNEVKHILNIHHPSYCIVLGDTNSTLIGALAASQLKIPIIHIEAGLRSFDLSMPEERNRIVVDHLSSLLFAPSTLAFKHLKCEGLTQAHIVGNTIVDICLRLSIEASKLKEFEKYNLNAKDYLLVTIHREYTTREDVLLRVFNALMQLHEIQMILPLHPRTKQKLIEAGAWKTVINKGKTHIKIINPIGYLEFLSLMQNSKMVLTDSGGVQEEAITLHIPCLTLRENTERWETIHLKANRLIGTKPEKIINEVRKAWNDDEWIKKVVNVKNPYGDGHASEKIVSKISEEYYKAESIPSNF